MNRLQFHLGLFVNLIPMAFVRFVSQSQNFMLHQKKGEMEKEEKKWSRSQVYLALMEKSDNYK